MIPAFCVLSRNLCLNHDSFLISSKSFVGIDCTFMSITHFMLVLVYRWAKIWYLFILIYREYGYSVFPASFVENTVFYVIVSHTEMPWNLCWKLAKYMWVYLWTLHSFPLLQLSVLNRVPHCPDYSNFLRESLNQVE